MAWQAGDEEITRLEKLTSRRIGANRFDVWDVWTNQARWWVIMPFTNLYLQADFQSLEIALTYHVGITQVLGQRYRPGMTTKERNRGPAAWRKWDQASEALESAEEAEEFQAVAMRLREGLLTFLRGIVDDAYVPTGAARPKAGSFIEWTALICDVVASGQARAELRGYLKNAARTTWQLVNWLTHAQNATRGQAFTALTACDHLAGAFLAAIVEYENGPPLRCPACGSYQLKTFYPSDRPEITLCAACDAEV